MQREDRIRVGVKKNQIHNIRHIPFSVQTEREKDTYEYQGASEPTATFSPAPVRPEHGIKVMSYK